MCHDSKMAALAAAGIGAARRHKGVGSGKSHPMARDLALGASAVGHRGGAAGATKGRRPGRPTDSIDRFGTTATPWKLRR